MLPRRRPPLLLASLLLVVAACGSEDDAPAAGATEPRAAAPALDVVATTSVLGDFAAEVGGDRVDVHVVVAPNVDAHDVEPTPADLEALRGADVVLANGLGLEEWLDDALAASGTEAAVVDTSQGVPVAPEPDVEAASVPAHGAEDHGHEGEGHGHEGEEGEGHEGDGHDHGDVDPHIWHDPANAEVMVGNVADAFVAADPGGRADYEAGRDAYLAELAALDAELSALLADLPVRTLVTNHDAFGWFAARYDLEVVGSVIPSFETTAELSTADVAALVERIRAADVRAVFAETTLPADAARAVAEEAGVTVVAGEDALHGDGLGPEGSEAGTYVGMMRHNATTIARHLGQA